MKGKCVQKDVIYHAEVKGGGEVRKYVGSTVNFKRRHYGHTSSFRHEEKKHSTALSTHVWDQGGSGYQNAARMMILVHVGGVSLVKFHFSTV